MGLIGKVALMGLSAVVGYKYAEYKRDNIKCEVKEKHEDDSWDDKDSQVYVSWANQRTLEQLAMCKHCPCADTCEFSASGADIKMVDRIREKAAKALFDLSIACDPCVLDNIDIDDCCGDCDNCDNCDDCDDCECCCDDCNDCDDGEDTEDSHECESYTPDYPWCRNCGGSGEDCSCDC